MRGATAIPFAAAVLVLAGCASAPTAEPPAPSPDTALPAEMVPLSRLEFCQAVAPIYSAMYNADTGVIHEGLGADFWTDHHARAMALADDLVAATEGELRDAAERLRDTVDAAAGPPSGTNPVNSAKLDPLRFQWNEAEGGCIDLGAEIAIMSEFGG